MDVISISDTSSSNTSTNSQPLDPAIWKYSCQGANDVSGKPKSSKSSIWMIHSCRNKRKTFTISDSQVTNSHSTEHSSATWSNRNKESFKLINSDVNDTPCANTKVNSWLNECSLSKNNEDYNQICYLQVPSTDASHLGVEKPLKGSILIRHDFKKDCVANENSCLKNWLGNEKHADDDFTSNECTNDKVSERSLNHSEENDFTNDSDHAMKIKQKCYHIEVPLSPESQKKNELCSYLQLMNMHSTGKKIRNVSQQRRSTRVKNLIILSEKRKLEQKLHVESIEKQRHLEDALSEEKHEDPDKCDHIDNHCLSTKSFAELNINLVQPNKTFICIGSAPIDTPTCLLKGVPKNLLYDRCDFETMIEFMRNENISASKPKVRRKVPTQPAKWKSKVLLRSISTSNVFLRSRTNFVNISGETKQLRWTQERMLRRRQFRNYIKQKDKNTR